jgi:hypothetical protein
MALLRTTNLNDDSDYSVLALHYKALTMMFNIVSVSVCIQHYLQLCGYACLHMHVVSRTYTSLSTTQATMLSHSSFLLAPRHGLQLESCTDQDTQVSNQNNKPTCHVASLAPLLLLMITHRGAPRCTVATLPANLFKAFPPSQCPITFACQPADQTFKSAAFSSPAISKQ